MGVVWEVFEAVTAGLGEAGAVRISYYLSENMPSEAKRISHKVILISVIQGLLFGSIVLMLGPNIAVWLTVNPIIQTQFVDLVGMTALASFSMTFALVTWSLLGAQGRFGTATACVVLCRWFIIMPLAAICVFGYHFETKSVAASIAMGYSTAAFFLSLVIIRSDWEHYALLAQEEARLADTPDYVDDEEEADEDDLLGDSSEDSSAIL